LSIFTAESSWVRQRGQAVARTSAPVSNACLILISLIRFPALSSIPLDVTHQVFLIPNWMEEQVKPLNTPFSDFLIEATGYGMEAHLFKNRGSIFLHDPLKSFL